MLSKRLLKQFNRPDTHLVISGYPVRGGHDNNYGISWYTKETIGPIAQKKNVRFVVLAETNGHNEPHVYQDGHILVLRVFDQRRLTVYPSILKWLSVFNKIDKVYVHSEFAANGGIKNFAFLIPFLTLIKINGRKISYFAHNFIESFDTISGHFNFKKGSLKLKTLNTLVYFYNHVLTKLVDKVIVLDDAIKQRVQKYVSSDRIISFPISIKIPSETISKNKARAKLNIKHDEKVLLYFGFVTWYKGADWLINQVSQYLKKNPKSKIRLIVAGGEAHSLRDKRYYQKYYRTQLEKASKNEKIIITGFVPEKEIGKYFAAADLVVYPYRGLIGASGSLSYALSYNKPFMLGPELGGILNSSDIKKALNEAKLKTDVLIFKLNKSGFAKVINTLGNESKLAMISRLSKRIARLRDYEVVMESYYTQIFTENNYNVPIQNTISQFIASRIENLFVRIKSQYAYLTIKNEAK